MNKTKKGLKKGIRFKGASDFQVNSAGSHAREKASVSLRMASLHFNKNRPEVVYSCTSESGLLLQADLYFKVVAICVPENSKRFVDGEPIKI